MAPRSLRLEEFSDREFLFAIHDALNQDGWATVHDIQAVLQLDHPYATSCIGSRCGYLRSVGALTVMANSPASGPNRWTLTKAGEDAMNGKLSAQQTRTFANLHDAEVIAVMRALNESVDSMGRLQHALLRREFRYGDSRRRKRW